MKREEILIGKSIEELSAEAYTKFGADGDISVEILEMPKKGFLGIGSTPAKIKVIIDDGKPEPAPKAEKKEAAPAPKTEKKEAPKQEKKQQPKPEKKPAPKAEKKEAAPAPKAEAPKAEKKYEPVTEAEMEFALEFVRGVLRDLEVDAQATAVKDDEGNLVGITVDGDSTGILIGHHGETLDAIQYLANLSASRRSPTPNREFIKMTVDVEGYRAKREETLKALARRMAEKAVKYKRNFVLEPMNPYERRIIHSEIQGIENVSTHSVGSDENRKVVVTYEGADKDERRSRGGRGGDRRGGRRGGRRGERRESAPETVVDTADTAVDNTPKEAIEAKPDASSYVMFDNTVPRNFDGWGK